MSEGDHWRCKSCGFIMSNNDYDEFGGFCKMCRED